MLQAAAPPASELHKRGGTTTTAATLLPEAAVMPPPPPPAPPLRFHHERHSSSPGRQRHGHTKPGKAASITMAALGSVQRVRDTLDLLRPLLRCNRVPPEGGAAPPGYSRREFKVATGRGHTVPMVTQVGQDGCRLSILEMRQCSTPIPLAPSSIPLPSATTHVLDEPRAGVKVSARPRHGGEVLDTAPERCPLGWRADQVFVVRRGTRARLYR